MSLFEEKGIFVCFSLKGVGTSARGWVHFSEGVGTFFAPTCPFVSNYSFRHKKKSIHLMLFFLLGMMYATALRVIPTSAARWGSHLPAPGGRCRGGASTAAVEKSEDKTRQRPNRFFGHRKGAC